MIIEALDPLNALLKSGKGGKNRAGKFGPLRLMVSRIIELNGISLADKAIALGVIVSKLVEYSKLDTDDEVFSRLSYAEEKMNDGTPMLEFEFDGVVYEREIDSIRSILYKS